jgi:hypothetical protein
MSQESKLPDYVEDCWFEFSNRLYDGMKLPPEYVRELKRVYYSAMLTAFTTISAFQAKGSPQANREFVKRSRKECLTFMREQVNKIERRDG